MSDVHLTLALLRALARGELDPPALMQLLLVHVIALCQTCKHEIEAFEAEHQEPEVRGSHDYSAVFDQAVEQAASQVKAIGLERQRAREDLRTLLRLPQAERFRRRRRAKKRFKSPFLAELLLNECRSGIPARPEWVRDLAEVAHQVAKGVSGTLGAELQTLALAHQGNALRCMGQLAKARKFIDEARTVLRLRGVTSSPVCAELDWFDGVLNRDQRQFPQSEALLTRAAFFYHLAEQPVLVARTYLSLGELYRERGDFDQAYQVATEAREALDEEQEPWLYLCAVHNQLFLLAEAGKHEEAREGLRREYHRYQTTSDSWTQLRLAWLEAKIARGLGELTTAEDSYRAARNGFLDKGNGYDTALVSLELATLYLDQGRTADVKRLAEEITPIFTAEDVHREAAAALMLFQKAARQEAVTLTMVTELATYLQQARRDPKLRFRQV